MRRIGTAVSLGVSGALLVGACAAAYHGRWSARPATAGAAPSRAATADAYGKLPLYFIENRGQTDRSVAYYVQGRNKTLFFTPDGVTFALTDDRPAIDRPAMNGRARTTAPAQAGFSRRGLSSPAIHGRAVDGRAMIHDPAIDGRMSRWSLKLDFLGANPNVRPRGEKVTPALVSYFKGPRAQQHTGLKTYSRVVYRDLWPGIDLEYSGTASKLKYQFVVHPGADPSLIQLAYRGATSVQQNRAGQLEVQTPAGGFVDEKPFAYQEIDGQRVEVASSYAVGGAHSAQRTAHSPDNDECAFAGAVRCAPCAVRPPNGRAPSTRYTFHLAPYDATRPLVIDPAMVLYAGFIDGADTGIRGGPDSIAVDGQGALYLTGAVLDGLSFPTVVGPDTSFNGGNADAFVAKVKPNGSGLVYAGYIGGEGEDFGLGIAVDSTGAAYITGGTRTALPVLFPVIPRPAFINRFPQRGAFVAKVNPAGTGLVYGGIIGCNLSVAGEQWGEAVAVDSTGAAYIIGYHEGGVANPLPEAVGPNPGSATIGQAGHFVAKVKPDCSGFDYIGYIDLHFTFQLETKEGPSIVVDGTGAAYISGRCKTGGLITVTGGPDLDFNGGTWDAFVAKIKPDGSGFVYSGYIGGAGDDIGRGLAVDASGAAYVSGHTNSGDGFPQRGGLATFHGGEEAFVVKVQPDGSDFAYAGFIGGSEYDWADGIAVDGTGAAWVTGNTHSTESSTVPFPVLGGPDPTHNGDADAFLVRVKPDGSGFLSAGFLGGSDHDEGHAVAVDATGAAYLYGLTTSPAATFPTLGGPSLIRVGGDDAFVAKVSPVNVKTLTLTDTRITGCRTVTGKVILSRPAGRGGLTVTLAKDPALTALTLPAALSFSLGQDNRSFTISAADLPNNALQSGNVTAGDGQVSVSKALSARSIGPQSVTLSPNPVTGGAPATGTVTLECAANATTGPITVALHSAAPAVAKLSVNSLTIPIGSNTGTFGVTTIAVTQVKRPEIKATANGKPASRVLQVTP